MVLYMYVAYSEGHNGGRVIFLRSNWQGRLQKEPFITQHEFHLEHKKEPRPVGLAVEAFTLAWLTLII